MKRLVTLGMLCICFGFLFLYREEIVTFVLRHFVDVERTVSFTGNDQNRYFLGRSYAFVQSTNDFEPNNKQEILNIYYSVLDRGMNEVTFYCPDAYTSCIDDVKDISNDQTLLSNINNFVHPYNSFRSLETEYDALGKVTIRITHTYTDEMIEEIEAKRKEITSSILTNDQTNEEKIKIIHDYIIQNSKYDSQRSDEQIATYQSDTAYGNLIQGYGICSGYVDSMKLFLDDFGINNYKIASNNHVWNLVELNGEWLHLDLTWDDPVVTDGSDVLEYNFFLITTEELQELETNQHTFDTSVYQEAN